MEIQKLCYDKQLEKTADGNYEYVHVCEIQIGDKKRSFKTELSPENSADLIKFVMPMIVANLQWEKEQFLGELLDAAAVETVAETERD